MDFQTLTSEVTRRLDEASPTGAFWTQTQIKESINKAYRLISDAAEWYETTHTIALTAGQYHYDMFDSVAGLSPLPLTVRACHNDQTNRWMRPTTARRMDQEYMKWETATGEPDQYMIHGIQWLVFDRAVTVTAGTVTVYYTAMPTDLSANGDTPAFPQEFHFGLIDGAMYDLMCQDRENNKARFYYDRYRVREEGLKRYVNQRESLDRVGVLGRE